MKHWLCSKLFVLFFLCLAMMSTLLLPQPAWSKVKPSPDQNNASDNNLSDSNLTLSIIPHELDTSAPQGNIQVNLAVPLWGNTSHQEVRVHYRTTTTTEGLGPREEPAVAGEDFVPLEGTLVFMRGQNSLMITVEIIGGPRPGRDKVFFVELFSPIPEANFRESKAKITLAEDGRYRVTIAGDLNIPHGPSAGSYLFPMNNTKEYTGSLILGADKAKDYLALSMQLNARLTIAQTSMINRTSIFVQGGNTCTFISKGLFTLAKGESTGKGGRLTGTGTVTADVLNNGVVSPGADTNGVSVPNDVPGTLTVEGAYEQTKDGTLRIEIGGKPTTPGTDYDQLIITRAAKIRGPIEIKTINTQTFKPTVDDTYQIVVTSGLPDGRFATTAGNAIDAIAFSVAGVTYYYVLSYKPSGVWVTIKTSPNSP